MAKRQINQRITADIVPMDYSDDDEPQDMFQVPLLKRKLLADFGRPSVEPPLSEHMKVYLRIRPFTEDELNKGENQNCLNVDTSQTVRANAPKDSHYFKNATRGFGRTTHKYTFSHIFRDDTSQKEFFNQTMLGLVKDFIDGQNCLVFSYGVTNSGKTYTIQGNAKDGGVLPRALDVLFNSISGQQWDGMNLKPDLFMNVIRLTPDQELIEKKIKERVMKLSCDDDLDVMSLLGDDMSDISVATNTTTCSESSNISTMDPKESLDTDDGLLDDISNRDREDAKVSVDEQGQIKFSVWVSFAEIYNEQIYDLLEPISKKKNAKRPCLKLSEDQNGSPYIKGLKYVHVNSADEAYKLMTIGQRNLKTACTKLNHNSSRSHCIFNIKILRVVDKDDPHVARVSMLSLCDLAGSERYSKSQTSGDRLKEAGNINTSLLTLGRCIETLRHNQAHKANSRLVPFRESKLTRLFQNFFSGRGKAIMFVNVNQCSSMFDETQHVFKFSAIASQVVVQQKPIFIKPKLPVPPSPNPIPKTSISWATPAKVKQAEQRQVENIPLPEESDDDIEEESVIYTQENIDELLGVIEQLQNDLETEVKNKTIIESKIRREVCEEMMKQFTEIEEKCSERIREREAMAEEFAEKRMQLLMEAEQSKKKKKKAEQPLTMTDEEDEWVSSIVLHQETLKVQKRDEQINNLNREVDELNKQVSSLEDSKDSLKKENASLQQQLTDLKSQKSDNQMEDSGKADVIENLTQQLQQARQQIKEQEAEISELNDMLTEAGETFQQSQQEISGLKELTQDYEKKIEQQAEAIAVLERAASDSKVAIETADQSLTKREESVSGLQSQIRNLEGSEDKVDLIPESPCKSLSNPPNYSQTVLDKFRQSISDLDLSTGPRQSVSDKVKLSSSDSGNARGDSSGVVPDYDSEENSDGEVFFKRRLSSLTKGILSSTQKPKRKDLHSLEGSNEDSDSGSDIENIPVSPIIKAQHLEVPKTFNFGEKSNNNFNYMKFHKPLNDSRVLQVVLTPLKNKVIVKHTKSSMLRMKNSPVKDPTRGRECLKSAKRSLLGKENTEAKRKFKDHSDDDDFEEINTSKRRRVVSKKKLNVSRTKRRSKSRTGQKYNLRTRK